MDMNRLQKQLQFLVEIDKLKTIIRQTILIDKSRLENDAEHSWHFAMAAIILYEYVDQTKVDISRVVKMALIHDLVEIYSGDTYAYAENYEESVEKEKHAADRLFTLLPEQQAFEFRSLWEEFDKGETEDAKYALAIDTLQPQLNNYYTQGELWLRNKVTSDKVYKRAERIKNGIPQLWPFWDSLLQDSIEKGYLEKQANES